MVEVEGVKEICSMRKEAIKLHLDNFSLSLTLLNNSKIARLSQHFYLILDMLSDIVVCRGKYFLN